MGFFSQFLKNLAQRTYYVVSGGSRSPRYPREAEAQEICRSIWDCTASHISKAQVLHIVLDDKGRVSKVKRNSPYTKLFERPNPMMSKQEFLYALAYQLESKNTALAWIDWDGANPRAVWPIAYSQFAVRGIVGGGWAIEFYDMDGRQHITALEDMVVLRRHFDGSGVAGLDNSPVSHTVELVSDLDDSLSSAAKFANKMHGILKQKRSMLAADDVKSGQEEFKDRMAAAAQNGGGVLVLDASEEYTPVVTNAWAATSTQMAMVYQRLYTYWRTPAEVVTCTANEQTMQSWLGGVIEPVWEQLSQAFTAALFTRKEQDFGNRILFSGSTATGASWTTKLAIVNDTKELGLFTQNEFRELLGWSPVEDGDVRMVSLNYIKNTDMSKYQLGVSSVDTPKEGENDDAVQTE